MKSSTLPVGGALLTGKNVCLIVPEYPVTFNEKNR